MTILSELVRNNIQYILIVVAIILLLVGISLIRKIMWHKQKIRS